MFSIKQNHKWVNIFLATDRRQYSDLLEKKIDTQRFTEFTELKMFNFRQNSLIQLVSSEKEFRIEHNLRRHLY